jgi:hypothetical protein
MRPWLRQKGSNELRENYGPADLFDRRQIISVTNTGIAHCRNQFTRPGLP